MGKYNEYSLIKEAEKRGYRTGTLIDYESMNYGTDRLGNGEFKLVDDKKLIKYETPVIAGKNPLNRRYDTVWREDEGWTKIVNKTHGLHL